MDTQPATGQHVPERPSPQKRGTSSNMLMEREITDPVALLDAHGKLNPEAVGYSRTPLHDTSGIGAGTRA
ncbi:hypothetical protein ACIGB6_04015 [Paeniglutamicibacter gangotriensis]